MYNMCWNADISINTFMFACLALVFIYIANTYTRYKSDTFKNPLVYLFLFEVASMQLLEFFLWRNLNNKRVNKLLSQISYHVILIQIITLMFMVKNANIKHALLGLLALTYIGQLIYIKTTHNIKLYTTVGENGHIVWEWMNLKNNEQLFLIIYLLFYTISIILIDNTLLNIFVLGSLFFSLLFYYKYSTFGTMWCWMANLFLLYFIVEILLIKPFYEYNGLC